MKGGERENQVCGKAVVLGRAWGEETGKKPAISPRICRHDMLSSASLVKPTTNLQLLTLSPEEEGAPANLRFDEWFPNLHSDHSRFLSSLTSARDLHSPVLTDLRIVGGVEEVGSLH